MRYSPCCLEAAPQLQLARCTECGTRLVRCMSYATCGTLIDPALSNGHCSTCVQPIVSLDFSALRAPKSGEQLALSFVFENPKAALVPITCEQIEFFLDATGVPVSIGWAEVEADGRRRFTVTTPPFERAGSYSLRLLLTLNTRSQRREERYIFETFGQLDVSNASEGGPPQIVISGAVSDNALINITGLTNTAGDQKKAQSGALIQSLLQRADLLERQRGLRGLKEGGGRVRLDSSFRFVGFNVQDCPPQNSGIGAKGLMSAGRAGRGFHAETNPEPNDIALPVYKDDGSTIDIDASLRISRRHFDLMIMNDRLYAAVLGARGAIINGEQVSQHSVRPLEDGDTILLARGIDQMPAIRVRFDSQRGDVDTIMVERTTARRIAGHS